MLSCVGCVLRSSAACGCPHTADATSMPERMASGAVETKPPATLSDDVSSVVVAGTGRTRGCGSSSVTFAVAAGATVVLAAVEVVAVLVAVVVVVVGGAADVVVVVVVNGVVVVVVVVGVELVVVGGVVVVVAFVGDEVAVLEREREIERERMTRVRVNESVSSGVFRESDLVFERDCVFRDRDLVFVPVLVRARVDVGGSVRLAVTVS
jgi:hypothetical protein